MKNRTALWDKVKGIGILLVILGHTYKLPQPVYNLIYSFHMPLFFMISGYLYNDEKYSRYLFPQIFSKKFKSYVIPYLLFSFVNMVLLVIWNIVFGKKFLTLNQIAHYLEGILYCYADVQHMPNCSPIWFLMCLFLSSLVFWAILKYFAEISNGIFLGLMVCSYGLSQLMEVRLPWNLATVGMAVFFMGVGRFVREHDLIKNRNVLVFSAFGVFTAILNGGKVGMNENTYGSLTLFLFSSISLSLGIIYLSNRTLRIDKILQWLGRNTLIIIGFNYFIRDISVEIYYFIPIIRKFPLHWGVCFMITSFNLSILIFMYNKIKIIRSSRKCLNGLSVFQKHEY